MSDSDEINARVHETQSQATERLKAFLFTRSVSIARARSDGTGEHWGSGSYLAVDSRVFLLTNRHVAIESEVTALSHVVKNGELMAGLTEPYQTADEADIALMPIRPDIWNQTDKQAVPFSAFDVERPAWDELLMVVGFPQAASGYSALASAVRSKARPYLAQPDAALGDDGIHFWMKHRPNELKNERGGAADWVNPQGMSGSLVWNTGIVASVRAGVAWSEAVIKPAGLLDASDHEKRALRVIRLDVVWDVVRAMLDA